MTAAHSPAAPAALPPAPGERARSAVHVRGLRKRFDTTVALDGVDLHLAAGEVRGLLGPNGAGKTTLLRLLFGLLAPDAGAIELLGRPVRFSEAVGLHGVAGFVEEPRFYPYLSARTNLELLSELDGGGDRDQITGALERVGLGARAGERVSGYSTGMRQRLGIAAALLRSPALLLLDEPTAGLDPAGVRDTGALVRSLADDGVAVLLSSHQIGEVEAICDSFTVLRRGAVVWDGTAAALHAQAPVPEYRIQSGDDALLRTLAQRLRVPLRETAHDGLVLSAGQSELDRLVLALGGAGVPVRRLELRVSPLETIFFTLTQDPS